MNCEVNPKVFCPNFGVHFMKSAFFVCEFSECISLKMAQRKILRDFIFMHIILHSHSGSISSISAINSINGLPSILKFSINVIAFSYDSYSFVKCSSHTATWSGSVNK